jgi:superfamily II DNA or RNA helicase
LGGAGQKYPIGSLVRARERDWIVLPSEDGDVLRVKPVTGSDDASVGLFLPLEQGDLKSTSFSPPNPEVVGDPTASRILFDAARLLLRSSAAPFRCAGRLSFNPRPYQFVPLIMALRLDPVRLLLADDVGVGKTIEAGMIARELVDRGIARRMLVLCPAHLCDQWAQELSEKFGFEPVVLQPANVGRLQRNLPRADISIFEHYPCIVASIDFVKSDRNKPLLLRHPPELVIVDEAHLATRPRGNSSQREQQQRYELVHELAQPPDRNLVLVTATPHSGIEENFRSLIGLLDKSFDLDTGRPEYAPSRTRMLPHIIQRPRADVEKWLGSDKPFPKRIPSERVYSLSAEYKRLFDDVLGYCQSAVDDSSGLRAAQRRVRYWAAIAMLRSLLSSPRAADMALSGRARRIAEKAVTAPESDEQQIDEMYGGQVLEFGESSGDNLPVAAIDDPVAEWSEAEKRRLNDLAHRARELVEKEADAKLHEAVKIVRELLKDGYSPIVFCHYIATANYVAERIQQRLADEFGGLRAIAVTGDDPDEVRREKIKSLGEHAIRVLAATDCLSEGINLQEKFNAVLHYDLPWNPNRLWQREGRVDRYGQQRKEVRMVTLWGPDNQIDQVVMEVLIRKAQQIKTSLGIAVPVPAESQHVLEAVVENVLLRRPTGQQMRLGLVTPEVNRLHADMEQAANRETEDRAYYSNHGIQPDEVAREIEATDRVLGDQAAVRRFMAETVQRFNGSLQPQKQKDVFALAPGDLASRFESLVDREFPARVVFERQVDPDALYLGRLSSIVEETCRAVLGEALGPKPASFFARAGASFTTAVSRRTVLLLMRIRYLLRDKTEQYAEEVIIAAFENDGGAINWLEPFQEKAKPLLDAPLARVNMPVEERSQHVNWALKLIENSKGWSDRVLSERVRAIEEAHLRLRAPQKQKQNQIKVTAHPPDILGCYVLVPTSGVAR